MPLFLTSFDLLPLLPEITLVTTAILVMFADLFSASPHRKATVILLSILGLAITFFLEIDLLGTQRQGIGEMIIADNYSIFFEMLFLILGGIVILISWHHLEMSQQGLNEFYILILFAIIGMMLTVSSQHILVIFIGIETTSLCGYILAGIFRQNSQSSEAAIKYLLMGAIATGFLIYGFALLYGATGNLYLPKMIQNLSNHSLALFGVVLVLVGLCGKIALFPFHFWVPDVYSGAPSSSVAFLASASKAAMFAAFARLLMTGVSDIFNVNEWNMLLAVMATLTMTIGNLLALRQTNIRRMLAYSSIAHAGYTLMAVVVGQQIGIQALMFYIVAYSFMSVGSFGILGISRFANELVERQDLLGYGKRHPILACCMSVFLFSLMGFPLTVGFLGKVKLFSAALESSWFWLVAVAVVNSVIAAYYYLSLIVTMYSPSTDQTQIDEKPVTVSFIFSSIGVASSAIIIIYLGISPDLILELLSFSTLGKLH